MLLDRKTAVWTGHHPSGPGKRQISTASRYNRFAGFLPPNSVMTMMRPNERMGNFRNRITDMICIGVPNIEPRQRNSLVCNHIGQPAGAQSSLIATLPTRGPASIQWQV